MVIYNLINFFWWWNNQTDKKIIREPGDDFFSNRFSLTIAFKLQFGTKLSVNRCQASIQSASASLTITIMLLNSERFVELFKVCRWYSSADANRFTECFTIWAHVQIKTMVIYWEKSYDTCLIIMGINQKFTILNEPFKTHYWYSIPI